ncbi:MAG: hypothetical protein AAFY16_02715, partial [Cyanobacteria bacterium J06642_3]
FTEPLDDSADTSNLLGYTLFGNPRQVGTDILDEIGNGQGAIGFEGALPSGVYTFALQQLDISSDYILEFNVSEATSTTPAEESTTPPEPETSETPEEPTTPSTGEAPVVSFEVVPETFSEEAEDNLVEWRWTVTGDFPEAGIIINLDTSGGDPDVPFDFTNQFAAEPESEFVDAEIVDFDDDTGRLNVLLTAPEASFQLFFANDIIEEGTQPFEFQLAEGDGYTVDPETNGTIFTITDDNGGSGVGPTVGISASTTELVEGDAITINFTVDGEIPEGGVQILVQSPVAGALGQFDISDLSTLELTGIAGLPEVGDAAGGSFLVTLTEPTASITTSVFDDILAEEALEIPFEIVNGEEYEVNPDASGVTLNIADEAQPEGPTVGLTVDRSDVIEGETITLTFNVEGEIPEGGVRVLVNDVASAGSEARSLTEFDVANIETTGIEGFPEPADGDSGFLVDITESTATITLPVFDEGADEDESQESFTFEVIDGEAYQVNPDAGSITLNIADVGDTPGEPDPTATTTEPPTDDTPVVSLSIEPDLISEEDVEPLGSINFSIDGEIPEDGLSILVNGDLGILDQVDGTVDIGFENTAIGEFFDPETNNFEVVLTENEGSIALPILNDIIQEEDAEFGFTILENDGSLNSEYAVDPDANSDTVTLTDGNGGAGVGPNVGLSFSETELSEGEEFTVDFDVDGEIPATGLTILVDGETPGILGEFTLFDSEGSPLFETTGIDGVPVVGDTAGSSFLVTLSEPDASITLSTFAGDEAEGLEEFSFNIVDGEIYEVDSDTGEVAFSINDGSVPPSEPSTELPTDEIPETPGEIDEAVFNFEWTGQIAGFSVEGQFSYDEAQSYTDGIVREENLLDFDISFFDPDGNLLRTYEDNHLSFPEFNFAYDIEAGEILQDGYFLVDDGFNVGEKTAVGEAEFTGLNFWSRPEFNSQGEVPPPHLHIDDWGEEFGFPLGFSSHEDVAFLTRTTQELLDTGRVGETYIDDIQDSLDEIGQRIEVTPIEDITPTFEPLFGSIDGDIIEATDGDRLIFAGDSDDLIDLTQSDGNNRAYTGDGDDTLILGENNRIFGEQGSDRFFFTTGGDNTVTGGEGADQFWIANAEIPEAVNMIEDFTSGEDVIGISGLGVNFSDLDITDFEGATLISANGNDLAIINNAPASFIANEDHFAFA